MAPALVSGWLLSFTLSWDDLVITQFVAGPGSSTLPMVIFSKVRLGVSPDVNALATIMVLFVATGLPLSALWMRYQNRRRERDMQLAAGRQPVKAKFQGKRMSQNLLGIDVGGSSVKAGVVDVTTGQLLGEMISAPDAQALDTRTSGCASLPGWPRACRRHRAASGVAFPSVVRNGRDPHRGEHRSFLAGRERRGGGRARPRAGRWYS